MSFCFFQHRGTAQGTTVSATKRDASRLKVMVQAISLRSSRTMPVVNTSGRKNADGRQGGGHDGPGHLTRALHRRGRRARRARADGRCSSMTTTELSTSMLTPSARAGQRQNVKRNAGKIHPHDGKQHAQRHTDGLQRWWSGAGPSRTAPALMASAAPDQG